MEEQSPAPLRKAPEGAKPAAKVEFSDRVIRVQFKGEELFALASAEAYGKGALSPFGRKALARAHAAIKVALEKESAA